MGFIIVMGHKDVAKLNSVSPITVAAISIFLTTGTRLPFSLVISLSSHLVEFLLPFPNCWEQCS